MNLNVSRKYFAILLIVLYITKVTSLEHNDENLLVQINSGKLKGSDKGYYYSFEGIPYAKAPVNELRFEAPQRYDIKWDNVYDASKKSIECMQWDHLVEGEYKLHGSEDCLYLNVYKPKTGKESYPVLAYLHGGAFMFGSVDTFGEDYLMKSGQVILVTIAYRLGPLGFLSTGDESISGNYGLKDQQMALKWIKENIHNFGGNAEKILLIGFSAGAASTHLHVLQSSEQNLITAAASISGTALNSWAIHKNPLKKAIKLAKHLECPNLEDTSAIKHCLQQKPAKDIVASVKEFFNIGYNPVVTFGPVVEHKNAAQAFITEHPGNIIKSGNYLNIPWLASYTAQDGGYNAAELLQINPKTGETFLQELNTKWLDLATENLFLENIYDDPKKHAQILKQTYLGNLSFSEETYLKVQEMYTDMIFRIGIEESLKLHSSHHNKGGVYGYLYDNPSDLNVANFLAQRNDMQFGTVHSDDFSLMMSFYMRTLRPDEEIISQKFIKMLEDFVNEGNLTFGDCKFVNNAGNTDKLEILFITKDKCENKVVV